MLGFVQFYQCIQLGMWRSWFVLLLMIDLTCLWSGLWTKTCCQWCSAIWRLHWNQPEYSYSLQGSWVEWHNLQPSTIIQKGLIDCLLNRIWRICTTQDEEVVKLKKILIKNEYPTEVIDGTIAKYIARITISRQPKEQKMHKRFIVLPFVKRKVEDCLCRIFNTFVTKTFK